MLTTAQVASLSDSALDAAFAAEYDARRTGTKYYGDLSGEISYRVASVWSFVSGAFGSTRFPMWEARTAKATGFSQSQAAQASIKASAANVASTAGSILTTGATFAIVGLIAAGFLVYQLKKK